MIQALKRGINLALHYEPMLETADVRAVIEGATVDGLPYCPPDEGDLLYSLIRTNGYSKCLETGFHTGSTALYMVAAVEDRDGSVVSVCVDDDESVARGLKLLRTSGQDGRHRLVRANSNRALAEMFLAGERFDCIFMDGWKTFDHLAFEAYLFNQLLGTGGAIFFDDTNMPSVRMTIRLLMRYYGYQEVDYSTHNQTRRLRLRQFAISRSMRRPYRALTKTIETDDQIPFRDWHYYRRI